MPTLEEYELQFAVYLIYLNSQHDDQVQGDCYQQQGIMCPANFLLGYIIFNEMANDIYEKKTVAVNEEEVSATKHESLVRQLKFVAP